MAQYKLESNGAIEQTIIYITELNTKNKKTSVTRPRLGPILGRVIKEIK